MDAAGLAARARRRTAIQGFAAMVAARHDAIRRLDESLGPLPASAYMARALGVRELVHDLLVEDAHAPLTDLVPELVTLFRAVVAGA